MSLNRKAEALSICNNWNENQITKTVFENVSNEIFYSSLVNLIESNGENLYQSTNTCGVASMLYLSATYDIVSFTKFAISLFVNGVGVLNDYEVKLEHNLKSWSVFVIPNGLFNGVSLVVIGSVRFVENSSLRFNPGTMDGLTWPGEIINVSQRILHGVLNLEGSFFLSFRIHELNLILEQDKKVVFLHRTSSWKEKGSFFKDAWHYVVLIKILKIENNIIEFSYWDYGKIKTRKLSLLSFIYGSIKTFVFSKV